MTDTAGLPVDMIIRTPPGSPAGDLAIMISPAGFRSGPDSIDRVAYCAVSGIYQAESSTCGVPIALHGADQVNASRFRELRMDIPFNRFMSKLLEHGELLLKQGQVCA